MHRARGWAPAPLSWTEFMAMPWPWGQANACVPGMYLKEGSQTGCCFRQNQEFAKSLLRKAQAVPWRQEMRAPASALPALAQPPVSTWASGRIGMGLPLASLWLMFARPVMVNQ